MTAPPTPLTRGTIALLGVVLAATALVYVPALGGEFVYDDVALVRDNPLVRRPWDLATIFTSPMWAFTSEPAGPYWRPLLMLSFGIDHAIGDGATLPFHATSVLLHVGATALAFALGRRLSGDAGVGLATAALFGLHPLATESVAWISARSEPMATCAVLGGLLVYVRGGHRRWTWSVLLLLGLLARENALLLVALCAAWELRAGRPEPGAMRRLAPGLVSAAIYAGARLVLFGTPSSPGPDFVSNPMVAEDIGTRALSTPGLVSLAARLWVAPLHQSPDYSFEALPAVRSAAEPGFVVGLALCAGLVALFAWARRRAPTAFLGLVFALLCAGAYLLNALYPFTNLFAERYLYLPTFGVALTVAALGAATPVPRGAKATLLVLVAVALGALTASRAAEWRNGSSLFESAVAARPGSAVAHNNLAEQLAARGDREGARTHFQAALEIHPTFLGPRIGLANLALDEGRPGDALRLLDEVARSDPENATVQLSRGEALAALDDLDGAATAFEAGLRLAPWSSRLLNNLASIRYRQGEVRAAEQLWQDAIRRDPDDFLAHFNLAGLFVDAGRHQDAMREFRRFLETAPGEGYGDLRDHALDALGR